MSTTKQPYNDEDLDRQLESVLHLLYRRSPERFWVIVEKLKKRDMGLAAGVDEKPLRKSPQDVV